MPRIPKRRGIEQLESRCLLAGDLMGLTINELVAVNQASLETRVREESTDRFRGDSLTPDWIELFNASESDLDLTGAAITDDAKHFAKWEFPAGTAIPAGGYLVVLASGLDLKDTQLDESEHLHTSFRLDAGGEYLAILDAESNVVDAIESYPKLDADLAFGRGADGKFALLTEPTLGGVNSSSYLGQVVDTEFSVDRGFFTEPFSVAISTPTEGATIRYTLDGSEPSETNGTQYNGPITISTTTNVRAVAFKAGFVSTDIDTQTYLFVQDVIKQPAEIAGFPFGGRVWAGGDTYVPQDTEMDPDVVNDPAYAGKVDEALLAIPTISIASNQDSIFGNSGWYDGEDKEGAISVEVLYPNDAAANQQINAGIESHSHDRLKRSLRLNFREEYGESKFATDFFQRSPVTGSSANNRVNSIILRAGNNRSWARIWNPDKTAYTIDEFYRSSQVAMSGYGMRGQFAHLYINGVYWGLYNPVERADDSFMADYFGGREDDWFIFNHGGDLSGNDDRWDDLRRLARNDMSVAENYEELKEYLHVDAFIDYLIISWWTAVSDWPQNNYYGANRNESASLDADPLRFVGWDGEWSWGQGGQSSNNGRAHVHSDFRANRSGGQPIAALWHAARENPEFLTLFQDRVYQHLYGNGALTEPNAQARWTALNEIVREAVIAESARWGDSLEEARQPTRTRDVDWQREVDRISGLIDGNNEFFLNALRREEFYPEINPPTFSIGNNEVFGGVVSPGTKLKLVDDGGVGIVYLGLDGVDPRSPDGTVSPNAVVIANGNSIDITRSTSITVRRLSGEQWSAANRLNMSVANSKSLNITEVDFNPGEPNLAELAAGITDNDAFEFIEFVNSSDHELDLNGIQFTDGIQYDFPNAVLASGEVAVIARNTKAFRVRYGNEVRVLGQFAASNLSNGGEHLEIADPNGQSIAKFTYDDGDPWPGADGDGNSLHRRSIDSPIDQPTNWFASQPTPGVADEQELDLNNDNVINASDIDHLCARISAGDLQFDFNQDGILGLGDLDFYVGDLLGTSRGDANLDGMFNSTDFVAVFTSAEYEDAIANNSGWSEGDWNCDGDFTSGDIVAAFQDGKYIAASRPVATRQMDDVAFALAKFESSNDRNGQFDELKKKSAMIA